MKLPRPYIPLDIRCKVAQRMCKERGIVCPDKGEPRCFYLDCMLRLLFPDPREQVELHHRPALCNREKWWHLYGTFGGYHPDANDPEFLCYVTKEDHHVETRVRGPHGQHSDLALLRKRKRILRRRQRAEAKARRIVKRQDRWEHPSKFKRKWPKRKFPKRRKLG